jgi:hypothetical protein
MMGLRDSLVERKSMSERPSAHRHRSVHHTSPLSNLSFAPQHGGPFEGTGIDRVWAPSIIPVEVRSLISHGRNRRTMIPSLSSCTAAY